MKLIGTAAFIKAAKQVHGGLYDYSHTQFESLTGLVRIKCSTHGIFTQQAREHLQGSHCYACSRLIGGKKRRKSSTQYIKEAKITHGDRYDYSVTEYQTKRLPIKIICKQHGLFEQEAGHHLRGANCPKCKRSKMEDATASWLTAHGIAYVLEKKFQTCVSPTSGSRLPFDFFLPAYSALVECDGVQHFEYSEHWYKGRHSFEQRKSYDKVKTDWAATNRVPLLRISYKEDLIAKLEAFVAQLEAWDDAEKQFHQALAIKLAETE